MEPRRGDTLTIRLVPSLRDSVRVTPIDTVGLRPRLNTDALDRAQLTDERRPTASAIPSLQGGAGVGEMKPKPFIT